MVMSKIFFHDNGFQEYMTLKDCPYCHDSVNFTEIAKNPRIVRCNICGLYRLYPRMNRQGQIAMLKYNEKKIEITKWKNKLVNKKIFYHYIIGMGASLFVHALSRAIGWGVIVYSLTPVKFEVI